MAEVTLGAKDMGVGQGKELYTPIPVLDKRAYLIFATMTVSSPNNVFSFIRIQAFFTRDDGEMFFLPQNIELEIFDGKQSFYLPMSELYSGDGNVQLQAERLPKVRGGADSDSPLTLSLSYDDGASIRTWL